MEENVHGNQHGHHSRLDPLIQRFDAALLNRLLDDLQAGALALSGLHQSRHSFLDNARVSLLHACLGYNIAHAYQRKHACQPNQATASTRQTDQHALKESAPKKTGQSSRGRLEAEHLVTSEASFV